MASFFGTTSLLCLVAVVQQLAPASGFLFPDLKLSPDRRASPSSLESSRYRIAVLQQEPYLFANGSGYIPDLMRHVAQSYRTQRNGEELVYEVTPVSSWSQLMSRAKSSHGLALGLIIPSLELTGWTGRQLPSSVPAVYTTLKLVVSKRSRTSGWTSNADGASSTSQIDDIEAAVRRGHAQTADRIKMVVLRGSPAEYLLVRANGYHGPIHSAETPEEAVNILVGSTEQTVFLTDAVAADHIANKYSSEMESICPSRLAGSGWMHYAFFGRDEAMIGRLNEALVPLMSDDTLVSLYTRHFGAQSALQCPW